MPWPRQTLAQLRSQAQSDFGTASLLRFSNLRVIADVLGKGFNAIYGYVDWISKQSVPFTATDEYLEAWAALKTVTRKGAAQSGGQAQFTGTASTPVPAGTIVNRTDGFAYVTLANLTIASGGTGTVAIQASLAGSLGNSDSGTPLSLSPAISGVTGAAAVGPLTGGADVELDPQLKTRMLVAFAEPAQGGSVTDYVGWTEAVSGVTRAWCRPNGMGPGTVVCFFMMDSAEAAHGGFPQGTTGVAAAETRDIAATGDQLVVANYVFTKCNVNALVYAAGPTPNQISLTISGLALAGSAVQAAIAAAITQVFLSNGSPGGVALTNGATGGVILLDDIEAAINSVAGSTGFTITAASASAGTASATTNIGSNVGCLPVLGTITWS